MQKNLKAFAAIAVLGASLAISGFVIQDAMAANGANKSVYTTNEPKAVFEGAGDIWLANTTMKTSKPQDALVLYNEECSLYTAVNLKSHKSNTGSPGDELDEVHASHKVQLYVDDVAIEPPITMCDRTYGMETNILNQIQDLCSAVSYLNQTIGGEEYTCDESFLNTWIDTKSAHGWNWVVLNLGQDFNSDGEHTFAIKGTYEIEDEDGIKGNGNGTAVTMQRSLIVIPTQLDVGAGE